MGHFDSAGFCQKTKGKLRSKEGKMRLAIVNLTGGGFSGGYTKYLKNMLPLLAKHDAVDALLCISPEGSDIASWFSVRPDVNFCSCSPLNLTHIFQRPDGKMVENLKLFSPDVIFLPVDRYVSFGGLPVVNMVRNMEPFVSHMKGDTLLERTKKIVQRKLTSVSVHRADHTIAVSKYVQDYLTESLHVARDKVSLVYHGLNPPQRYSEKNRPTVIPEGWDNDFLFTCGSVRPARGLEDALDALKHLSSRNMDFRLVIAGETVKSMENYRQGLEFWLGRNQLTDHVCWAGKLNAEELRWCYNKCRTFVMTSRIEACPNIAMEALSNGAIVVAASNPPLPEFFSDCAIYYEPTNGFSLAEAIINRTNLTSDERNSLSERACMRSHMYSWETTAEKTIAVLGKVVEQWRSHRYKTI